MKTGLQVNTAKKGLKKPFRIPMDLLSTDTEAMTWQKSHRNKSVEIQPIVSGNSVVFVWKTRV